MKPVSGKNSQVVVIDTKDLPSKGLPYNVSKIEIRDLTLEELKYLSSENLPESSLVDIYKNAIYNINVETLSWVDFLFIASHISLFTDPALCWTVAKVCLDCRSVFKQTLKKESFFDFEDLNIPDYPIITTLNNKEIEFGVFTVKARLDYQKTNEEIPDHLKGIYALSYAVLNMTVEDAYNHFKSITNRDEIEVIDKIPELLYHDVKPLKLTCTKCGVENEYEVGLEVSTIRPFRENGAVIDSRISFGKRFK